eukprot:TRINITY_DN31784_c0_g1_i1.p1 TRINITY_DN31784_c0_g1~~TRINITY_DN31784_c0_g1_i1.p1  ORF type:complete len:293 (-),score=25.64 TRINITY_DN31784_c0_g1_i1:64-942(-)
MVNLEVKQLGGDAVTISANPGDRLGTLGCQFLSQTNHPESSRLRVRFSCEEKLLSSDLCVRDLPSSSLLAILEHIGRVHVECMGERSSGGICTADALSVDGEDRILTLTCPDADSDSGPDSRAKITKLETGQRYRGVQLLDMTVEYKRHNEDSQDSLEVSMQQSCDSDYTIALLQEAEFGIDLEVQVVSGGEFGIDVGLITKDEFEQLIGGGRPNVKLNERTLAFAERVGEKVDTCTERLRLVDSGGMPTLFRGSSSHVSLPCRCHWFVAARGHDGDFGEPAIAVKLLASQI